MCADSELARLLEHPAIWRGRSAARTAAIPTGFDPLDDCLPGRGWPRTGLMEILVPRFGIGELYLLLPALAALTRRPACPSHGDIASARAERLLQGPVVRG